MNTLHLRCQLLALVALAQASGPALAQDDTRPQIAPSTVAPPGLADYEAGLRRVAGWLEKHPDLVTRVPIGKSVQGRELFVLRVTSASGAMLEKAPEMYLGGGIHGMEHSEQDALWMCESLLAHRRTAAVEKLLATRILWVQPFVNPDGIVTRQRKNARGVDLNRNFAGRRRGRAEGRPLDSRYPGPRPFSEPETRAVRDFLRARKNLRAWLDLHRSAQIAFAPEVSDAGPLGNACQEALKPLIRAMGGKYAQRQTTIQLRDAGFSIDWAWRELGVIAFTWELNSSGPEGFREADVRWKGLMHLLDKAGQYRRYSVLRFATFNTSLHRARPGALALELKTPDSPQAKAIAEILQRVRPDVVLLCEFDWDAKGEAVQGFQRNYLGRSQQGALPIEYRHVFRAPSNTGVDSGFDLDNDGRKGGAGDAFGFGSFVGQYGMVLLSRHPIDVGATRTFRKFLWKEMPEAAIPEGWYSEEELAVLRLSSKSHWDVVVDVHGTAIHALCAHPTPPVFDGKEDRNGRRNHDEIRLFADYIVPDRGSYIVDDRGRSGGLPAGAAWVILGDYNSDPNDGDSRRSAIRDLLQLAGGAIDSGPASQGAEEAARRAGGANAGHSGSPRLDTGSFGSRVGNLRLDYVLPSQRMRVMRSGVFWPPEKDPLYRLVGPGRPVVSSDHRMVWADVEMLRK